MIQYVILYLPFFACLFSLLLNIKLAPGANAFKEFCALMSVTGLFYLAYSAFSLPGLSPGVLVWATLMVIAAAPCIIPLLIMFFRKVRYAGTKEHPAQMLWLLVPAVMFTAALITYYLSDTDVVESLYQAMREEGFAAVAGLGSHPLELFYTIVRVVLPAVMLVEIVWLAAYVIYMAVKEKFKIGNLHGFYFGGKSAKVSGLLVFFAFPACLLILAGVLMTEMWDTAPLWLQIVLNAFLASCIIEFAYVAMFSSARTLTRKEQKAAFRYNYNDANKSVVVEEMLGDLLEDAEADALRRLQEKISEDLQLDVFKSDVPSPQRSAVAAKVFAEVSNSWGEEDLLVRFQKLMRDEMLFLQPRLSLDDVAERLGTNKFYVSKLVNNAYNLGFPELVNILRVDYAEQYILAHRTAKQEEIASECGFPSASSFNTTFKKVTGLTPKVWIASRKPKE